MKSRLFKQYTVIWAPGAANLWTKFSSSFQCDLLDALVVRPMGSLVPTKRQGIAVRALIIQLFEVPITSRFSSQLPSLFINLCITSLRYVNVKVLLWFRTVATRWSIAACNLCLKKLLIPAGCSIYSWMAAWQMLISILVIPVY